MRKRLFFASLITISALFYTGCSFTQAPIHDVQSATVQGAEAKLTQTQVEQAILKAGVTEGWRMQKIKSGLISAIHSERGHSATVEIAYSASSYSIKYKDSVNLKYDGANINQNYNSWVQSLDKAIQKNFLSL
ncbi:MAG: hypothetical protein ACK5LP_03575 [Campylobacteraceae bacterium]